MQNNCDEMLRGLFSQYSENRRRDESIKAYQAEPEPEPATLSVAYIPEPDITRDVESFNTSRKRNALRSMLYDIKGRG